MNKQVIISNHIYSYYVCQESFIWITNCQRVDGPIDFTDSYPYCMDFPEMIEGLPVLHISSFSHDINTEYGYSNKNIIRVSLPENASFFGFDSFLAACGYQYPAYKINYYKRTNSDLLFFTDDKVKYFAKMIDDKSCEIIYMSPTHRLSNSDVYNGTKKPILTDVRCTEVLIGDDYKDWGWMQDSSKMINHKTVFRIINHNDD